MNEELKVKIDWSINDNKDAFIGCTDKIYGDKDNLQNDIFFELCLKFDMENCLLRQTESFTKYLTPKQQDRCILSALHKQFKSGGSKLWNGLYIGNNAGRHKRYKMTDRQIDMVINTILLNTGWKNNLSNLIQYAYLISKKYHKNVIGRLINLQGLQCYDKVTTEQQKMIKELEYIIVK